MRKLLILYFLLFCFIAAQAERVNRDTEVFEEAGTRTIAQLYKGSGIYIVERNKGWAKIIAVVVATNKGYNEYTLTLPKKTKLLDIEGNPTGYSPAKLKLPGKYRYEDSLVVFELIGYIRETEIDTNWIIEHELVRFIDSAGSVINFTELEPTLKKYRFFITNNDSGFVAYAMADIPGLNYYNAYERIKLVFYENRLIAIFHSNPLKLKRKEAIMVDGKDHLIYLRDLSAAEKRVFGNLFLGE